LPAGRIVIMDDCRSRSTIAMHWQTKRERRPVTNLAPYPDPPAVKLNKLPAQGEPQPGALDLLRRRPHLAELLEYLLLILWGNANPGCARLRT
jgi:hypothetical protein